MSRKSPNYKFKTFSELFPEKENNMSIKKKLSSSKKKISSLRSIMKINQEIVLTPSQQYNHHAALLTEGQAHLYSSAKSFNKSRQNRGPREASTNSSANPLRTSTGKSSSVLTTSPNFEDNVKELEKYIGIVKDNVYNKNKDEIKKKNDKITELQHRIDVLTTFLRLHRRQKRNFSSMTRGMQRETGRLTGTQQVK